jgi:hypothetical protein
MLLFAAGSLFPYGDTLNCYKIDPAHVPVIDGNLSDAFGL